MKDYSKLVEALRCKATCDWTNCGNCKYADEDDNPRGCWGTKIYADAAAAIEALQAKQKKTVTQIFGEEQMAWEGRCKDLMYQIADLQAQLPKRGEWIWIQKENGGQYKGCSVCHAPIPTDSMLDYLDDEDCDFCYSCGAKMEVQDGQE